MKKDIDYSNLELSSKIIVEEAIKRGIKVEILDMKENFIKLSKGNKIEYIKQATKTSVDKYVNVLLMENKFITKKILSENNFNTPKGYYISNKDDIKNIYEEFKNIEFVVKPNSTNFGIGISILESGVSFEDFEIAIDEAFNYDSQILIEEFIDGKEYRFLVINDKVPGILHRVPANVIGDGKNSIKKLIEIKNDSPLRGTQYKKPLQKIKMGLIESQFLKSHGLTFESLPKKNEIVYLRKNSNISTGGDSIDFTDDIINEYKEIAINATKSFDIHICGVDIIIKDIKSKPNKDNYSIIELNFNPAIFIHNHPYKGKNRKVEEEVFNLLGF